MQPSTSPPTIGPNICAGVQCNTQLRTSTASACVSWAQAGTLTASQSGVYPDSSSPNYFKGPPDCRNPTWCLEQYIRRTDATLSTLSCFMDAAFVSWGPAVVANIAACMVFALIPPSPLWAIACFAASGIDAAMFWAVWNKCHNNSSRVRESAENSYCACLFWKRGHCSKVPGNMPEDGPHREIRCTGKYKWPGFDR